MAIVGLTVSEDGQPIQRLAVSTKVAIGEVKMAKNGKTYPSKLDHFVFLRKGAELGWEPDPELTDVYGTECRAFWVFFMSDDLESVFRTQLAWWTQTERKCWGDGRAATRRTEKNPDGETWSPCGDKCPQFDGDCKPSGDLYFRLVDFPRIGATCRIHTSGKRSVMQIQSALMELQGMTGGRLMGVKAKLVVRPEKTSYFDEREKKKKPTVIFALNLEHDRKESMEQLIGNMTEYSRLFERTQKLLGGGRVVVDEDPEEELAKELHPEFYPAEEIAPAVQQPARASAPASEPEPAKTNGNGNGHAAAELLITKEQWQKFLAMALGDGGWSQQQIVEILKEKWKLEKGSQMRAADYDEIFRQFKDGKVDGPGAFQASDQDLPDGFWK
jgi:hypothetical protein